MKFMLLKNKGGKYFQTDTYSLNDYVYSLRKFLSISPEEFMSKIIPPEGITYEKPNTYFEVKTNDSTIADNLLESFSQMFRDLVHENNHTMPLHYKFMMFIDKEYTERKVTAKINYLSTLRFWRM